MLVLSSQVESYLADREKGSLHDLKDQLGLMRVLTKQAARVTRVRDIPPAIAWAMQNLRTGRPRPVHLEFPLDVLSASDEVAFAAPGRRADGPADPDLVEEAARRLAAARRPRIWAGGGAVSAGAGAELLRLAEWLQAPVLTTAMGKGVFPEDHALSLGAGSRDPAVAEFLAEGDVLLAVGTRLSAMETRGFAVRLPPTLIHCDVDPWEIDRNYPATIGLVGDARATLQGILAALARRPDAPPVTAGAKALFGSAVARSVAEVRSAARARAAERGPKELAFCEALRAALPPEAILVADMTLVAYTAIRFFPCVLPRTFLFPRGFGTLGFAVPAAIGARIGRPDRPVVSLAGDGGFLFTGQELATAVKYRLPIPFLVVNDQAYGVVKRSQIDTFGNRTIGVDVTNPDFVRLGEAFGARAVRLGRLEDLGPVLERALGADGPTLVEVVPPVAPEAVPHHAAEGRTGRES